MRLNFKKYGTHGTPLIILHGLLGSLDNWHQIAGTLSRENFVVYTIDQRNHGRSPHDNDIDYPLLAEDLLDFINDQHLDSILLMGHSMGAKVAMLFALNNPERITKLIAVDMSPKAYPPQHYEIFDALLSVNLNVLKSREDAERQLESKIQKLAIRQFLLKNLSREGTGNYYWKMNMTGIYGSYPKLLKPIVSEATYNNPTLFIRGASSNYILDEDIKDIKKLFPLATLTTIQEAGHWVHADAPEVFLLVVKNFFLS